MVVVVVGVETRHGDTSWDTISGVLATNFPPDFVLLPQALPQVPWGAFWPLSATSVLDQKTCFGKWLSVEERSCLGVWKFLDLNFV